MRNLPDSISSFSQPTISQKLKSCEQHIAHLPQPLVTFQIADHHCFESESNYVTVQLDHLSHWCQTKTAESSPCTCQPTHQPLSDLASSENANISQLFRSKYSNTYNSIFPLVGVVHFFISIHFSHKTHSTLFLGVPVLLPPYISLISIPTTNKQLLCDNVLLRHHKCSITITTISTTLSKSIPISV